MNFRIEKDYLGEKKILAEALYGIHTQRARENFQISGERLPLDFFYIISEIKRAAALVNMEFKLLDHRRGKAIIKAVKEILQGKYDKEFVIDAFQAGAGTPSHMNVNEVIANRAIELLNGKKGDYSIVHPNDHVNMGQSSNNVIPTAIKILAFKKSLQLLSSVQYLENQLLKKSVEFRSILKSGRTHLQDAVPITLGQEFHAYATSMQKNLSRIKKSADALRELNIGKNAVGTGINTYPEFTRRILRNLTKIKRYQWKEAKDPIYSTQNLTDLLQVSGTLRSLAVDLIKISHDLMLFSSGPNTGLKEIKLPAVEPGSSIMPGKVNPSMAEMQIMVCFQVIGNDHTISLAVQTGELDLNVMTPVIAKNLFESLTILNSSIRAFTDRCIRGITVNRETCQQYFKHSAGITTLLNPYIGYDKASEVVQESLKEAVSIVDVVLRKKIMTERDLNKILDYKNVTHPNLTKKTLQNKKQKGKQTSKKRTR